MRSLSKSDNVESVESKVDLLEESMLKSRPIEFKASSREFSFSSFSSFYCKVSISDFAYSKNFLSLFSLADCV